MEQEGSARERIMAAFIAMLEQPHPSARGMALIPQLAKYIDGHFRYICSFYDRKKLLKNLKSGTKYYLSFLSLSTEIERIPVSELTRAAGVNRTTFYKLFPNVMALYNACCEELTQKFLSVPVPVDKTAEGMRDYVDTLWRIMEENETLMFTLSHRVNKRAMPYQIARQLKAQLASSLTVSEQVSVRVQDNLEAAQELFSTWLSLITIDKLAPAIYPDQNLPAYDPSRSIIENIAACFAVRYGGSEDFYYTLGGAALKILSQKRFFDVKVSEFCSAAGYPRSTFYAHFTDFTDYVMKVLENSVLMCVSAFLYYFDHLQALTPASLAIFRGEMVSFKVEGVRAIFLNGSISYLISGVFGYLMRIMIAEKEKTDGPCSREFRCMLSYYLTYAMRMFMMYYIGDMTDAELSVKRNELERIKKRLSDM